MHSSSFLLPKPLGKLASRLPAYPGSMLLVTALNWALIGNLTPDVTQILLQKQLRLRVTDAGWTFDFAWVKDRFVARHNPGAADLTVSASAQDFVLLARRKEDPDTLFFNRRLAMEGDTELGLLVKNTLDAIELPVLNWEHLKPTQVLARLKSIMNPG